MKTLVSISLLMLAFVPGGTDAGPGEHAQWQRVLRPAAAAPKAEQCVVLDADLFAHAAPGLRDVRLMQDGREIPYAMDESFDDRAGNSTGTLADDRAQYETALVIPAKPSLRFGAGSEDKEGEDKQPGWFYGQELLPARVPVERVRVEPAPKRAERVSLRAAPATNLPVAETMQATLDRDHLAAAFTVGANLQQDADVRMGVQGDERPVQKFVLEMRRRKLCFQPLSVSPLVLLFGDEMADPVFYEYAAHYRPTATPVLAVMGPRVVNPGYRAPVVQHFSVTRTQRLVIALGVAGMAFGLTVLPLARRRFSQG